MAFITLDPRGQSSRAGFALAPRPETLDGAIIGLLANTKRNGDALIDAIAGLLSERYQLRDVVRGRKHHFDSPAKPELLDDLTSRCDVVLTAIGD